MNRRPVGFKFLDRYTNKQKLGKGAFGDVYLVEDQNGRLLAMKMMDRKRMESSSTDLVDYLRHQIDCMKNLKHKNLVQLYQVQEDEQFYYMFLQYCEGGDIANFMAFLPDKVFELQQAIEFSSQIITGLEIIHRQGYLHRDIKPQNILLKQQNGKIVLKIADFGFAKKAVNIQFTVCGTQRFMSPEIYLCGTEGIQGVDVEKQYGYEVDMWAFGVLLFYILNRQYPFEINPHWSLQQKYKDLLNQGNKFSYKKAVQKTRLKRVQNCTQLMEDLFRKIFIGDTENRIKFNQIRQHPVFKKYFPQISQKSQFLYNQKFRSSILSNKPQPLKGLKPPTLPPDQSVDLQKGKAIIESEFQEIKFLSQFKENICSLKSILGSHIVNMTCFNLMKYYVYLLKSFNSSFDNKRYEQRYSQVNNMNWSFLFKKDLIFKQKKVKYSFELTHASIALEELYEDCQKNLSEITKENQYFLSSFKKQDLSHVDQNFFLSYRQSTSLVYSKIKKQLKNSINDKTLYYNLCACCICHVFNQIIGKPNQKAELFGSFIQNPEKTASSFSFKELKNKLQDAGKSELLRLTQKIVQLYLAE